MPVLPPSIAPTLDVGCARECRWELTPPDAYRGLTPDDLFDIVVRHGLHFDQSRQVGVVFHMISALPQHGRVGLTAIGESHQQAQELYERTVATLDQETRQTSAG